MTPSKPVMPLRVGVVCDLREEEWHSMDLIADMLMDKLPTMSEGGIAPARLCPAMIPRWSRLALIGRSSRMRLADRLTGRLWDYPRWLAARAADFDVFHIVDHSYAHLVRVLPAGRTIVACHDIDALRAALPGAPPLGPARLLASGIVDGLQRAAHVACSSRATSDELIATGRIDPRRVSVNYLGVHPSCSPTPVPQWDEEIVRRLGPARVELLHVGSTIPRKRIDTLFEILAGLRSSSEAIRLVRVGGLLTPEQRVLAARLKVTDAIVELPYLERPALAALYRRAAAVLLTSEREGFGLPIAEAMACGTPVVASDIPALREVGGAAATYCPPDDTSRWIEGVARLLNERDGEPGRWAERRQACLAQAARFDWDQYARGMTQLYLKVASSPAMLHPTAAALPTYP